MMPLMLGLAAPKITELQNPSITHVESACYFVILFFLRAAAARFSFFGANRHFF
jgi:uncharacterized membrane protein